MRCTERLKNGTETCKNSSTILEEDLHNAIVDSLKEMLPKSDDIAKKVRDEIETVLMKEDNNLQVIQHKIQNFEKQVDVLRNISNETDDKEFYLEKIKLLDEDKSRLEQKIPKVYEYKKEKLITILHHAVNEQNLNINQYFDIITKNIIKLITINSDQEIKIIYL